MRSLSFLPSVVVLIMAPSITVTGFSGNRVGVSRLTLTTASPTAFISPDGVRSSTSSSSSIASSTKQFEAGSFEDIEQINRNSDAIFSVIDKDGNGDISLDELTSHLTRSGYDKKVVTKIFAKMDTNSDGSVSRDEFRKGMVQFAPLRSAPGLGNYNAEFVEEIRADADALFRNIDEDGDGSVTPHELKQYLTMVSSYSDKAIENIFDMLDVDKDGTISREEVRDAFIKYSALRQAVGEGPNFK